MFHHSFHLKLFEGRVCRQEMASPSERLNCERNFVFMMAAPRRTLGDGTGPGSGSKAQAKKRAFVEEALYLSTLARISEKVFGKLHEARACSNSVFLWCTGKLN